MLVLGAVGAPIFTVMLLPLLPVIPIGPRFATNGAEFRLWKTPRFMMKPAPS